jgi:hypothetical protein
MLRMEIAVVSCETTLHFSLSQSGTRYPEVPMITERRIEDLLPGEPVCVTTGVPE